MLDHIGGQDSLELLLFKWNCFDCTGRDRKCAEAAVGDGRRIGRYLNSGDAQSAAARLQQDFAVSAADLEQG